MASALGSLIVRFFAHAGGHQCILAGSQHPNLNLSSADFEDLDAGPLFAEVFSETTFG